MRRVRQETGQEQESPQSELSSGEETEAKSSEAETHMATPTELPPGKPGENNNGAEEEEDGDSSAVQVAMVESVTESFGESGRGLLPGAGPTVLSGTTQSDWYAAVDGLLLRDPSDRAPL